MQNFKVGDWVILNKDRKTLAKILEIDDEYIFKCKLHFVNENSISWCSEMQYYKHWKPTEGEWCWFLNNNREPVLKQFLQMCPIVPTNYISKQGTISGSVEPFIGQLPSFLKDNT